MAVPEPDVTPRVLIVEDDASLRRLLVEEIEDMGLEAAHVGSAEEAMVALDRALPDIVVSDIRLPGVDGMELLSRVSALEPAPSFVVITAFGTVPQAVAALKAGAQEFLTKPLDLDHLQVCLERILETRRLRHEVRRYRELLEEDRFHGMIGRSAAMLRVFDQIRYLARARGPVLILGESGTGKELAARAIHAESDRRDAPFVAVNCAGVPQELMESEFFGYREGAFTGASRSRIGLFQEADGGVFLLDEISEMPLPLQAKLLRVLQDGEVRRVGETRPVSVDVRVVAASHRDLEEEIAARRFREDLFYRLETFHLRLPPLRERGDDLELLATRALARFDLELGRGIFGFSSAALRILRRYPFPGNVRELQSAVERAATFCKDGEILPENLPARIRRHASAAAATATPADVRAGDELPPLAEIEERYIRHVLDRLGGNKRKAAKVLGISRRTLYRKLEMADASPRPPR